MKTLFLTTLALLSLGMTTVHDAYGATPRVNTIVVNTTGDVKIRQGNEFRVDFDMDKNEFTSDWEQVDSLLYLNGTGDFDVCLEELNYLDICSTGDVSTVGMLRGKNLSVNFFSTGDSKLNVDYNNVYVEVAGTGDLVLSGACDAFFVETFGTGDVDARQLNHLLSLANLQGRGDVRLGKNMKYIAYHAASEDIAKDYVDDSWALKCAQGSPLEFKRVDNVWGLVDGCKPNNAEVLNIMQAAGPFFSAESNRSWKGKMGDVTARGGMPDLDGLSELLAELGANLEMLSDSVDWDSFERDMEKWGESMEEWGRHMEEWGDRVERQMGDKPQDSGKPQDHGNPERWGHGTHDNVPRPDVRPEQPKPKEVEKKTLLFNPYWKGVDMGLNMMLGPGQNMDFSGEYAFLEQRPTKSWTFNFNIADVGIAFSRSHVAGLYTGVGLGMNNYSFNDPIRLVKGEDHLEAEYLTAPVKKSKLGVLYVQAPLMLEVRPARNFFIAAGVMGGVRVDAWTKIKYQDKQKEKVHSDYYLNRFKLDATLRAGSGDAGFFASFNLLPLFAEPQGPTTHTLNVGFSMIF